MKLAESILWNCLPACDNKLVTLTVSAAVKLALPETSLYLASSCHTAVDLLGILAPKEAFKFSIESPLYVVCQTTPILAELIALPNLLSLANQIIKENNLKLYLIAAGGISDCQSAYAKILCGAHLIQLYTSMTYEGPLVANKIIKGLLMLMKRDNILNIDDVRGSIKNPETAMKIAFEGFKQYKSWLLFILLDLFKVIIYTNSL